MLPGESLKTRKIFEIRQVTQVVLSTSIDTIASMPHNAIKRDRR